ETITIEVVVNASAIGTASNTALLDPDITSNEVTTEIFKQGTISADLSITKSADKNQVEPGDEITYTLIATNNGPSTAFNVTVSDDLSPYVEFVSSQPPYTSMSGNKASWNFFSIENGESQNIAIVVKVKENVPVKTIVNTATVESEDTPDNKPGNNESPEVETDVVGEAEDKIERGDNQWDKRPTFGINHETRETILVENGFFFNGESFTIIDNHHTPFEQKSINIGTENTFVATVYADKRLMVQEFLFGVPQVGMGHLAEMRIEVWYNFDGEIEDVKIVQETDVIDPTTLSVNHQKVKCIDTDLEEKCDRTFISAIFLEPLRDQTMAIKAIDFKFRDQTTYLNDGFEIQGDSLNPMATKMIPSNMKNSGLLKITQTEKYSDYWVSEDGRLFEMNSFGSFKEINKSFERFQDKGEPRSRLHSGFGGVMMYEQDKASKSFDSSKIISSLPDSFGYHYDQTERIDAKMLEQMIIEEQKAKEYLKMKYLQARW
ncbi:MAG: DUF11 domain-containing protein, partial [Candidatus Nitrosomaritimum aestuariumsis]